MKTVGLCLLFLCISSIGACRAGKAEKGIRQEEAFLSLIGRIRRQICCFHRPLSEIFAGFSGIDAEFDAVLRERGLEEALEKCAASLSVSPPCARLLSEFAGETGKSDAAEQIRLCDAAASALASQIASERAALPAKRRAALTLSFSGAAMAVLLCL